MNMFFTIYFLCSVLCVLVNAQVDKVEEYPSVRKKILEGKALLIDVRTPEEYAGGHLKYSKNLDFKSDDFFHQLEELDKNKEIYLYCRSGNRSGKTKDTLQLKGYSKVYNIGGLEDLLKRGWHQDQ